MFTLFNKPIITSRVKHLFEFKYIHKTQINHAGMMKDAFRNKSSKKTIGPLGWFLLVSKYFLDGYS